MWKRSPDPAGILITFETHPKTRGLKKKWVRTRLVEQLRIAKERHHVSILNYLIQPDSAAVLVMPDSIEALGKFVATPRSVVASEYARHRDGEGPFWKGKVRYTLILGSPSLRRCLEAMVVEPTRTGMVMHPCEYRWGGFAELIGARRRYRLADYKRLREIYGCDSDRALHATIAKRVDTFCMESSARLENWAQYTAVGLEALVNEAAKTMLESLRTVVALDAIGKPDELWALKTSARNRRYCMARALKRLARMEPFPQA